MKGTLLTTLLPPQKVTGDPEAIDEPIYSNVPFCKSFFAIPDPPVKLQACRSENCVAACDAAYTWGSCVCAR